MHRADHETCDWYDPWMGWGRVSAAVLMVGTAWLLSSCGLLGVSDDSASGSDWSVVELTTTTSTPTTTRPRAGGAGPPTSAPLRLSEQDLRAVSVCVAVTEVQAAGVAFWQAYESGDAGLPEAANGLTAAFDRLADVADPTTSALLGPVVADLGRLAAAPDQAAMRQVTGEVIEQAGAPITAVLGGLQPLCPGQLQPESLDQAERVELAVPPPSD